MASNEDRARERRAKRDAANSQPDEAAESLAPGSGDPADAELTDAQRAEIESRAGVAGAPIDLAAPGEQAPQTDFDPAPGGATVGGEVSRGGGPRVFQFFRASWAELKRVRWPNNQQVAQGTAVTLGFVVIAGAFLGVADLVARQIVNLIL
ncbi:MAG: preprotein translocase subunit SecE [Patulibacter sp.]